MDDLSKVPTTSVHDDTKIEPGSVEELDSHGEFRRSFTPRQIHMISLGGQIGAGLFISTGTNLARGGPGSLVLGFAVVCTCVWAMLQTVSEMSISFPVSGNFIEYAVRFVDPAFGFAAGVSMWLGWTAIVAAEATFFAVIVNYWAERSVPDAGLCESILKSTRDNAVADIAGRHDLPGSHDWLVLAAKRLVWMVRVLCCDIESYRTLHLHRGRVGDGPGCGSERLRSHRHWVERGPFREWVQRLLEFRSPCNPRYRRYERPAETVRNVPN